MLNSEPPFRYPTELYAERVEGNVSLRLFIDVEGKVLADSIAIVQSSGHAALDSVAVNGARELKFSPATRRGKAMAVRIIYPVYFRHPDGALKGADTVGEKAAKGKGDTT
jgi:TonB family protein